MRISAGEEPSGHERAIEVVDGDQSYVFHWYEIFPALTLWIGGERRAVWLDSTCGDPTRDQVRAALRVSLRMVEREMAEGAEVNMGSTTIRPVVDSLDGVPDTVVDELQDLIDGGLV